MYKVLAILLMIMLMPLAQAESYLKITNFEINPTENGSTMSWDYEGNLVPLSWEIHAYYIEPCVEEITLENIGSDRTFNIVWDNDRSKMLEIRGYTEEGNKNRAAALIMPLLSDNILSDEFLASSNADSHASEKLAKPNVRLTVTENHLDASWDPVDWTCPPNSSYGMVYQYYLRNLSQDYLVTKGNTQSSSISFDLEPGNVYRFAVVASPMFDSIIGYMYGDHWFTSTFTAGDAAPAKPVPYVHSFVMSEAFTMQGTEMDFQLDIRNANEGDWLTVMFRADDWTETFDITYPDYRFTRTFSQAGLRNLQFKVISVNGETVDSEYCDIQQLLVMESEPEPTPTPLPVETAVPTAEPEDGILNINEAAAIDADGRMDIPDKTITLIPHYYLDAGTVAEDAEILEKIIRQFDVMENYQPEGGTTYCNFFSGNVARAMGAFLPGAGDTICLNCYGIVNVSNDYTGWKEIISERNLYCNCGNRQAVSVPFNTKNRDSWDEVGKKKAADGYYHADLTKWFIEKSADFGWEVINDYTAENYANITDSTPKLKPETIQQAISYANQGYLVVGVRSDWILTKNSAGKTTSGISGHAFIVHPNDDISTLYTTQAGGSGVNRENKPDGGKTRSSNNGWNVYFVFKGID